MRKDRPSLRVAGGQASVNKTFAHASNFGLLHSLRHLRLYLPHARPRRENSKYSSRQITFTRECTDTNDSRDTEGGYNGC